jgi:TldD protein
MFQFNDKFYSDVRIVDSYYTTITYKKDVLENYKVQKEKRAFIRVFDGNLWLYTSTSDINAINMELQKLYRQGTPNDKISEHPVVKRFEVNRENAMRFEEKTIRNISRETKDEVLRSYMHIFKGEYTKHITCTYIDRSDRYHFVSSKGADIKHDYEAVGVVYLYALANEKEHLEGRARTFSNYFDGVYNQEEYLKKEYEKAVDFMLHAEPCKKGYFPVILSPEVAGVFAHESFGHKSEADFMIGDEAMRKEWALGKKVGSDILSIYDSGAELGSGYCPFDDEGTRTKKTYLIKNGILSGRLHSATTAADLNEDLTGNCRAINGKFEPIVRMTSTMIEGGTSTLEELISGIKEGYLIDTFSHGQGMSQFTIAPQIAYFIKDGKIDKPAKISVITGSVFETLSLIDGLTKDAEICSSITGGCGKMEQGPLHVSDGGPYVRVSKMNVQ